MEIDITVARRRIAGASSLTDDERKAAAKATKRAAMQMSISVEKAAAAMRRFGDALRSIDAEKVRWSFGVTGIDT